jgi:CMP-N,N'-diacetyllegionaminic acid synthase
VSTVALIPARGGSKGLPRKNLRLLGGRPLIAHSIAAGRHAERIDKVYVSTEDTEIARVARECGAEVIMRSAELAVDTATNDAVAVHAVQTLKDSACAPDVLVLLQPTSPLRNAKHVDQCLEAFANSNAHSAISVCPVNHPLGNYCTVDNGLVSPIIEDSERQRQTAEQIFRRNGAIYVVRTSALMRARRLTTKPCLAYIMERYFSVDIDDEIDLQWAEFLMANPKYRGV